MIVEATPFREVFVLRMPTFTDERGRFMETFREADFRVQTGLNISFVQDNESVSSRGVLRGLHAQLPPKSQAKLVRVSQGKILDVIVDLRTSEPTFGQHFFIELTAGDGQLLFVPEGFAHGFQALEDNTVVQYKCSNYYHADSEICLNARSSELALPWPIAEDNRSSKDVLGKSLSELKGIFF